MRESYRVGIHVGRANTDAVILDDANQVVAKAKTATTDDGMTGVLEALRTILSESAIDRSRVHFAMLSTNACSNAVSTLERLVPIGVIRLEGPLAPAVPPLTTWPEALRTKVLAASYILPGGHEFTGEELVPLDESAVLGAALAMVGLVEAVAICSVFSPVNASHELRAREIVRAAMPTGTPVTISSEIGSLNLLERENAAALNAALSGIARTTLLAFERVLRELGLTATPFFGQNDGTLLSLADALRFPVLLIASGPASSLRGAANLSGLRDGLVLDIGGTRSNVGILHEGLPLESSVHSEIGGVLTNFHMPHLLSIELGGDSLVHVEKGGIRVGPGTAGSRLHEAALVFGGDRCTTTDLAVGAGRAQIGEPALVQHLSQAVIEAGMAKMATMLEGLIDRVQRGGEDVPLVLVGGGNMLFPDSVKGVSAVLRPMHLEVANAIGVATAPISATVDQVFLLANTTRQAALDEAHRLAREGVLTSGADADTIEVIAEEVTPLAYMENIAVRVRVKLAGRVRQPDE